MKLSALVAIAAVIGGSFLIPNPAAAETTTNIIDARPGTTPGVYTGTLLISNGVMETRIPLLLNCRNSTSAHYNQKTGAISITPMNARFAEGRFCIRRYGWFGD